MEEIHTWRELLGKAISDTQERQRIAETLAVNPITLIRWASGISTPRQEKLLPLLDALPYYRQQLLELIAKEFPYFSRGESSQEQAPQEIPSAFYARILNAHANTSTVLRSSSICILILQQLIGHLDPQQSGMIVWIDQCMPPAAGQKVRSLRKTFSRATGSLWSGQGENWTFFYGAEAQAGRALMTGHPITIQNYDDLMRWFPTHAHSAIGSSTTYPILLGDRVAGCLNMVSMQKNYFSQARLDLIQRYAELMVLAFEREEFYNLHDIELDVMPHHEIQQVYLAGFHQRVTRAMIRELQNNRHLTRREAEVRIWQELEEELLHHARRGTLIDTAVACTDQTAS